MGVISTPTQGETFKKLYHRQNKNSNFYCTCLRVLWSAQQYAVLDYDS